VLKFQQDASSAVSVRKRRSRFSVAVTAASLAVGAKAVGAKADGMKSFHVNVGEEDVKKTLKMLDDTSKLNEVAISNASISCRDTFTS
jgi:hypothetical protein